MTMHTLSRLQRLFLFGISTGSLCVGCGGDDPPGSGGSGAVELTLQQETELFPNLDFSTGLMPPASPVQASFSVSAKGATTVSAVTTPSGSKDSPTLTGLPGRGSITIDGGFALVGQLVVDVSGLPSYDGPIPGIENVEILVQGGAEFDPFSIEQSIPARAEIPPAKLPGIPLPGGIPGQLVLEVAEGSFVELSFTGTCAGIDGEQATYTGRLERGGSLVIAPSVEVEVPVIGTKTFEIPSFTVDLALGGSDVQMTAEVDELGSKPSAGEQVTGACDIAAQGAAGAGGGGSQGGAGGAGGDGGLSCNELGAPQVGSCDADPTNCVCVGCKDDGVCNGSSDDCVCADCQGDEGCPADLCVLDGQCDAYLETCSCADCAAHPACL